MNVANIKIATRTKKFDKFLSNINNQNITHTKSFAILIIKNFMAGFSDLSRTLLKIQNIKKLNKKIEMSIKK